MTYAEIRKDIIDVLLSKKQCPIKANIGECPGCRREAEDVFDQLVPMLALELEQESMRHSEERAGFKEAAMHLRRLIEGSSSD